MDDLERSYALADKLARELYESGLPHHLKLLTAAAVVGSTINNLSTGGDDRKALLAWASDTLLSFPDMERE